MYGDRYRSCKMHRLRPNTFTLCTEFGKELLDRWWMWDIAEYHCCPFENSVLHITSFVLVINHYYWLPKKCMSTFKKVQCLINLDITNVKKTDIDDSFSMWTYTHTFYLSLFVWDIKCITWIRQHLFLIYFHKLLAKIHLSTAQF